MRRTVFLVLGSLELLVALVLVYLAWQLPGQDEVASSFQRVERVTHRAGKQVHLLQRQVRLLRRPALKNLAERLRTQTREVAGLLREQTIDVQVVRGLRDTFGQLGEGLHNLERTLDAAAINQLGKSLGETANFLDEGVIKSAAQVADRLDESCKTLRSDAKKLGTLLRIMPVDLQTVREVHDSLDKFSRGLGKLDVLLHGQRLGKVKDGLAGMENSLTLGARQVERLASYTYPVLTFSGWRPEIEQRQFWPDGDRIGRNLRRAAAGVRAAGKELDNLSRALPHVRTAMVASQKVVDASRDTLGVALDYRAQIEPLLKSMPANAQRLAEHLPRVGEDLARVLRQTKNLKEVAAGLRKAQKGMDAVAASWPNFRAVLGNSATLLQTMRGQMERALRHREEYQRALNQTAILAEAFALMLPFLTDQLLGQLAEEEKALGDLEHGIDEVGALVPEYGQLTGRLLLIGRVLAWLVAAIVTLHGGYLLLSVRLGRSYSV
jgi:hypothetical protein